MTSYYELNKYHIQRYNKKYYQKNKEEILEKMKVYSKLYYQKNRERILAKRKENYIPRPRDTYVAEDIGNGKFRIRFK